TVACLVLFFFFSSRRRHTRSTRDWSSDVCSSDLISVTRPASPDDDAKTVLVQGWVVAQDVLRKSGDLLVGWYRGGGGEAALSPEIGRASCRERGESSAVEVSGQDATRRCRHRRSR